ncbi:TraR/DksA family transcriptional regulator [Thiohalophilus sp.]|uniref:TraR/DksA family transcriptional regulator n=1 Tax=Thiohalophilus sp. TaxID=3028392 RepID=UPI003975D421
MSDTAHYRQALLNKRRELIDRVAAIADDSQLPASADSEEQAVELENEEVLTALDEEARQILTLIDQALQRLEHDEYGLCLACGKPIAVARLEVLPYAELCIDCAEQQESA